MRYHLKRSLGFTENTLGQLRTRGQSIVEQVSQDRDLDEAENNHIKWQDYCCTVFPTIFEESDDVASAVFPRVGAVFFSADKDANIASFIRTVKRQLTKIESIMDCLDHMIPNTEEAKTPRIEQDKNVNSPAISPFTLPPRGVSTDVRYGSSGGNVAQRLRLFIGSSSEQLDVAYAVQRGTEHTLDPVVWTQGIFEPSGVTIQSLLGQLRTFDAAVMVFTPDDLTTMRGAEHNTARDNVIFEFGLFIGALGLQRVFFLIPRGGEKLHLPTDLLGVTPLSYNAARGDGQLDAALGPACSSLRKRLQELGPLTPPTPAPAPMPSVSDADREFEEIAHRLAGERAPPGEMWPEQLVLVCDKTDLLSVFTCCQSFLLQGLWRDPRPNRLTDDDMSIPNPDPGTFLCDYAIASFVHERLMEEKGEREGSPVFKLTEVGHAFARWYRRRKAANDIRKS